MERPRGEPVIQDFASDITNIDRELGLHMVETADVDTAPIDPADLVNLPSRTLSNDANLREYIQETTDGQIPREVKSKKTGKVEKYELVTWKINDPGNPKNWSKPRKWYCTMVVAFTCFVVAFNSAVITPDIEGVAREFHVSQEVALPSISVFVIGFGVGKLTFC